jgi:hypothetical protein
VRFEHALHAIAETAVSRADDAGRDAARPVQTAGAHRRLAVGELRLADDPILRRPIGAVHRVGVDEDRGDNVVAAADVLEELVDQVAAPATAQRDEPVGEAIVQMVMRVHDRQRRIERGFLGAHSSYFPNA